MSIRIGNSCTLSKKMITSKSKCVETRRFLNYDISDWYGISQKCISEKKFLIVTICIDKNDVIEYFPSEFEWRVIVEDTKLKLLTLGANWNNVRVDIINEPVKPRKGLNLTKEQYANYINIAHNQMKGKLPIGAGCEEPLTAQAKGDMIPYICRNSNFEYLIIHIQGSCDTEQKTVYWINTYKNYAVTYKKILDCNEANLKNPCTSGGYNLLKAQLRQSELAGIPDFPIVFENLDTTAFIGVEKRVIDYFKTLSFQVNGDTRCPGNYNDWINLIEAKAPISNIKELPIIEEEEDMKLQVLKIGSKGNQVLWLQEILDLEYGFENPLLDGVYGNLTLIQVKAYQTVNNLTIDGIVGKFTMIDLIEKSTDPKKWFRKLQLLMAFE